MIKGFGRGGESEGIRFGSEVVVERERKGKICSDL
jgi:hypothetical protein